VQKRSSVCRLSLSCRPRGAIGWLDGLSIATGAPNSGDVHKFIDFMVSPASYVRWDTDVGAPASANGTANAQLPADAFNRLVLGDAETVSRLHFMVSLSDEQREKYLEVWEEVKTEFAQ
jgi:spermidine/putrescine transport system substrate-binding protein